MTEWRIFFSWHFYELCSRWCFLKKKFKKSNYKVSSSHCVSVLPCCFKQIPFAVFKFILKPKQRQTSRTELQKRKTQKKIKKRNKLQDVRRKRMQMLGACCHGDVQTLTNTAAPHWGDITAAATQTDRQTDRRRCVEERSGCWHERRDISVSWWAARCLLWTQFHFYSNYQVWLFPVKKLMSRRMQGLLMVTIWM